MFLRKITSAILMTLAIAAGVHAQHGSKLTVAFDQPVAEIQPTMWGLFFEDINFGADGGLYAELVKNRSFEFAVPMMGWALENSDRFSNNNESGSVTIINTGHDNNPRVARVIVRSDNVFRMINQGFAGMGIKKDIGYNFSVLARPVDGNVSMTVELLDERDQVIGSTTITPDDRDWKTYPAVFTSSGTAMKGKLSLSFSGKGSIDIDMVSLFPSDTWKNRPRGLRADLVQLLYDMKPGFLRFPGGCIVEGRDLSQRYQWKKTVGDIASRELLINRWNTEFAHRPAPDYFQSFGLGFYEYFLLAEDLGAAPLPILNCGMACQFNTAEVVPMDGLDPYVQDALDLIEFANGPVDSEWGRLRAEMGHPEPFNLTMIGVGNEQWGPEYIERYKVFAKAIKSAYPEIKIVSGTGPFPDGELFDYATSELKELGAEIVDEHYYRPPQWFFDNSSRYDNYDREGPKIFAGEYAAQSVAIASPDNKNNWLCALSEAAFMTGLERNADIVHLASYAPLLAHAEKWQWTPDLIWFDNLNAYATPNYYVQKLFSTNRGTHVLPLVAGDQKVTGQNKLYASAVLDRKTREIIIKIVNASEQSQSPEIQFSGKGRLSSTGSLTVLSGRLNSVNTPEDPSAITPVEMSIPVKSKNVSVELPPFSLSVLKFKMQ